MRLSRPPATRSLRAFCLAARHRSFKVAADELFLTPSAVSHQMKDLENTLGLQLFERKTRALELTTAGHTLFDEVEPLLEALDRSLTQIARRSNRRRLRIMAPPFFASELFVPRLPSFCTAHPDVDIHMETHDQRPAAHPASVDVSILLSSAPPVDPTGGSLKVERLFPVKLVAVCAREHAAAVARLGRHVFRDLALIMHKQRPFAWSNWAEEVGLDTPEPKHVIEFDTMAAVVRAAEAGLGVALVPQALCGQWFHSGALVRLFPVQLPVSEAYYLACRMKDAEKPEVTALMDWAKEEFRAFDERRSSIGENLLVCRPAAPPATV